MPCKRTPDMICVDCGTPISPEATRCRACARRHQPLRGHTPNDYRIDGDIAYLALTDRSGNVVAETMIDASDLHIARRYRWALDPLGYATCSTERHGTFYNWSLHRIIMGCKKGDGVVVDHINRNTLDNRRCNLRRVDAMTNAGNRGRKSASRFPGVTWNKQAQRWLAQGSKNGRHYFLGRYDHEEEAAQAYLRWRDREGLPPLADPDGRLRNVRKWKPKVEPLRPSSSKYIGVKFCKQTGRWAVSFTVNRKLVWLGRHDSEAEAAAVAGAWRRAHGLPTLRTVDALRLQDHEPDE